MSFSEDVKKALAEASAALENIAVDVVELAAKVEDLSGRVISAEEAADLTSKAQAIAEAAKAAAAIYKNSTEA